MKISACLVIHNEEKYLPRCLLSIKEIVDEIILIHDGECIDKSLEIAKNYGARIYIRQFVGEAEYHRPFSYQKANGDWILQIDADEFLNASAKNKIRRLIEKNNIDAYSFWWPYSNKNKYVKNGPFFQTFKPCLFRKKKMYMLGIAHEYPRTYGRLIKVKDIHLEHLFDEDKYSEDSFKKKWKIWAKIQAEQIIHLDSAPIYNIANLSTISIYSYYDFMRKHPIISGFLDLVKYFCICITRGIFWSGFYSWKIAWFETRYLLLVRKYLLEKTHEK